LIFPSEEWLGRAVSILNADPELPLALEGLGPDLAAVVEPDAAFPSSFAAWGRHAGGRIVEVRILEDLDEILELEPAYVVRAPYRIWEDILRGKADPVQVMLSRKLAVTGNLEALMRRIAYRRVIDSVLQKMQQELADTARRS
jgi:hypothetical protein